jgi:hypothetical protein
MEQCAVEIGNAYKNVVEKSELMRPSRRTKQRWKGKRE